MSERKRLSDVDQSSSKKIKLIQTTLPTSKTTRPMCKYGVNCYRKHPDHLQNYSHPTVEKKKIEKKQTVSDDDDDNFDSKPTTSSPQASPVKTNTKIPCNSTVSLLELAELEGEKLLSRLYQMDFPPDFYDFWKFCSNLNKSHPRDVLKNLLNIELVGPFEILDNVLQDCKTVPNIHQHYRYYYDTPEFMTIIRTLDKKSQFHIGYYRDSPDELPSFLASNDSNENNRFKTCGDNLFGAVHLYGRQNVKTNNKTDLKTFLNDLESYAKMHKYSLDETTSKINTRKKKINCTLLNSLGMVVPVENDIGYRPVPLNKDQLKKLCDKYCNSSSEILCQSAEDELQHIITCIQFANDECDYGEGLEFGLNLFLYGSTKLHSRIMNLLPLAYKLLHRDLYSQIITDHIGSGRSTLTEQLNQIEQNK